MNPRLGLSFLALALLAADTRNPPAGAKGHWLEWVVALFTIGGIAANISFLGVILALGYISWRNRSRAAALGALALACLGVLLIRPWTALRPMEADLETTWPTAYACLVVFRVSSVVWIVNAVVTVAVLVRAFGPKPEGRPKRSPAPPTRLPPWIEDLEEEKSARERDEDSREAGQGGGRVTPGKSKRKGGTAYP
jgi:hypothetical protein